MFIILIVGECTIFPLRNYISLKSWTVILRMLLYLEMRIVGMIDIYLQTSEIVHWLIFWKIYWFKSCLFPSRQLNSGSSVEKVVSTTQMNPWNVKNMTLVTLTFVFLQVFNWISHLLLIFQGFNLPWCLFISTNRKWTSVFFSLMDDNCLRRTKLNTQ